MKGTENKNKRKLCSLEQQRSGELKKDAVSTSSRCQLDLASPQRACVTWKLVSCVASLVSFDAIVPGMALNYVFSHSRILEIVQANVLFRT